MEFSERLRELIEDREITQKELAKQLNMAPSTLGGYVQGAREPDFYTLKLFADYFQVSTDFLLDHSCQFKKLASDDEVLTIFHSLTKEQQKIYLDLGRNILKYSES